LAQTSDHCARPRRNPSGRESHHRHRHPSRRHHHHRAGLLLMNSLQGFNDDHRGLARFANEDDDIIDVMKIWNVLWQAKLYIAALVIMACLVTAAVLVTLTPYYKATATLLIEKKAPQVLNFQQLYDPSANTSEYLQTQLGLLKSRALAERVVSSLS